ncbi:hypothetical protein G9A89_012318 [Geosiphon pyriformis]|nr:hypothetical protein G9A89_012318 [Geosiphon pyriformis]
MGNPCFNPVLESARFIFEHSQDVKIDGEGVEHAAKLVSPHSTDIIALMKNKYSIANWKQHELHPKSANDEAINWIFLVDLLNFSFWSEFDPQEKGTSCLERFGISFNGKRYTGYWSLCAAINRALKNGIPITTPAFYASTEKLSNSEIKQIFQSDSIEPMPLLAERINLLREAGQILTERFNGSFANCILRANNSAMNLLNIITENFPSFRDECEFLGIPVQFYKRAQILIGDIWACFEGQGLGNFHDIDYMTMFADYRFAFELRIPIIGFRYNYSNNHFSLKALHNLRVLSYSPHLLETLSALTLLPYGSRLEMEIRGCSIWAVELIRRIIVNELKKFSPEDDATLPLNAIILDFYIWDFATANKSMMSIKAHRTRSIFY